MKRYLQKENFIVLCLSFVAGLVFSEVCILLEILVSQTDIFSIIGTQSKVFAIINILGLFCALVLAAISYLPKIMLMLKSKRYDVIITFGTGFFISAYTQGIAIQYVADIVGVLRPSYITVILIFPVALAIGGILRMWLNRKSNIAEDNVPLFLNDDEIEQGKDDLLDMETNATRFAELISTNSSKNSFIYGVDGPWGIGKSSFLNLCSNIWEKEYSKDIMVYKFNPLYYECGANIIEKFIDGFINEIQKQYYLPELRPLFNNYSRLISANPKVTFMGIELWFKQPTIEDVISQLGEVLATLNKHVIVIVDDLDRLSLDEVKNIIFALKRSFSLRNISYILCYDTENIGKIEKDNSNTDDLVEYLEKFINIKYSINVGVDKLYECVSTNIERVLAGNSIADPKLVSRAVTGLEEIYNSESHSDIFPFVGNIRKIKRLINTIVLLDIEKTDFQDSDIENYDLILLILIYMYYPHIFRKIYFEETNGKRGIFSLRHKDEPMDSRNEEDEEFQPEYKNTKGYKEYIGTLSQRQNILVESVFGEKRLVDDYGKYQALDKRYLACFNHGTGAQRCLENYLKLISNMTKPNIYEHQRLYDRKVKELLDGASIKDIFENIDLGKISKEEYDLRLWRAITNSSHEISYDTGKNIIEYLIDIMPKYSIRSITDGLRKDLIFSLVKLIDVLGWKDTDGKHVNNTNENIQEIAERILGEGRYKNQGIVERLTEHNRGILGLYDLLILRLYCCANRGNDVFNIHRALAINGNENAVTEGRTDIIVVDQMRKFSQKVYKLFNEQYVVENRNIFELIDRLTLRDFFSTSYQNIMDDLDPQETDDTLRKLKAYCIVFITFQLSNNKVESGIGCGYYDPEGMDDKHIIREEALDYLFNICFSVEEDTRGSEFFCDYLLYNLTFVFRSASDPKYIPQIERYTDLLGEERLKEFWKKNKKQIEESMLSLDKKIHTGSYWTTYKEDLPPAFAELDKLIDS